MKPMSKKVASSNSELLTKEELETLRAMFDGTNDFYKLTSAKGKLVMAEKREQGETMHLAPLGYRNVRREGRSMTEIDPETWPLVQEAKSLRAQGLSIRTICHLMAAKGLRSQRGNVIGPSSMLKILERLSPELTGRMRSAP